MVVGLLIVGVQIVVHHLMILGHPIVKVIVLQVHHLMILGHPIVKVIVLQVHQIQDQVVVVINERKSFEEIYGKEESIR